VGTYSTCHNGFGHVIDLIDLRTKLFDPALVGQQFWTTTLPAYFLTLSFSGLSTHQYQNK